MPAYPHLKFEREKPINTRRPGGGRGPRPPDDITGHARSLQESLHAAQEAVTQDLPGFDGRPLFKLAVGTLAPEEIVRGFPSIEVVSQEDGGYALVFADDEALSEFEARLSTLASGGQPRYANILYALQAFDHWTPEDRKGWALKRDGLPESEPFMLDVELWPLGRSHDRADMKGAFESWIRGAEVEILDEINTDSFIAYRVSTPRHWANELLRLRDVRTVDLPPSLGLDLHVLRLDIQEVAEVLPPPPNAPLIGILDSGIASGHPLLGPALGDAQGFVNPDRAPHDDDGHGTLVAGLALYDDIEACARAKRFEPRLSNPKWSSARRKRRRRPEVHRKRH